MAVSRSHVPSVSRAYLPWEFMRVGRTVRSLLLVGGVMLVAAAPVAAAPSLFPAYTDSGANPTSFPIYVTAPPADPHRLFVVQRFGQIRVAVDGVMQDAPFLDLSTRIWNNVNSEAGVLSMAFAPDYATSGDFWVYFVEKPDAGSSNGDIHIERFQRSAANPNVASPTPLSTIEIPHDANSNHYGGQLAFGPDGMLYAGTGDGGGGNDTAHNSQNDASKLGKLLKIDPATDAVTMAAKGLRNPYRFSFDSANGDLIIGDVGQAAYEEIDWVPASAGLSGLNFGWPCREGMHNGPGAGSYPECPVASPIEPVLEYANPNGASSPSVAVTGGVVVRDASVPTLNGRYLYADYFGSLGFNGTTGDNRIHSA